MAILAFALCAWSPKAAHHEIRSLGVISALGDTCMFERVTGSPLDWLEPPQATFLEISDWNVDDEITAAITQLLGPQYRVQPITIEHQDFDTWTYDSLARHIRELPIPEMPVDAYLVVVRDWRTDEIGGSTHQVAGLGFYRRDFRIADTRLALFASYRLALLDPDTGSVIAERAAVLQDGRLPRLPVTPAIWPTTQNDVSNAERREITAGFTTLIDATLPSTLRRLLN